VKLSEQPWWTQADQAGLELLTHEFVKTALAHKHRCTDCRPAWDGGWCPQLQDAFAALTEWRAGRILRSRAFWLRSGQDLAEFALLLWPDGRPAHLTVVGDAAA
jgi:hypothetical protein